MEDTTTATLTKPGLFIVIEGMDGSGKSTAVQYLAQKLKDKEISCMNTREPGGTPVAQMLRLLITKQIADEEELDPMARLLMIFAARIQHIRNVIAPALGNGQIVLCDRFSDSTHVYQGGIDNLAEPILVIENMREMRYLSTPPDLTLFLDVSPEVSIQRTKEQHDKDNTINEGDLSFRQKLYSLYHSRMVELSKLKPGSVFTINADLPQEEVNKFLDSFVNLIQLRHQPKDAA